MTQKIALITGASRGIGAACALAFARAGYDICINYHQQETAAEDVADQVRQLGRTALTVRADVSNEAEVKAMFDSCLAKLGAVTVLVNNAGILKAQSSVLDMDAERINKILQTNVTSVFLCAKYACAHMLQHQTGTNCAIVNVSSGAARTGSPFEYVDYAASKGAVDTFTKGLSVELADKGIRVNGVRPGLIYTDMHADGGEPNRVDRLKVNLPLNRGGKPEEVAEAVYWLASEKSSFTTGSIIDVTGGK